MDAQVVHHHDPINNLQQGLVSDWLIGLLVRPSQQQAVVTVASLDFGTERGDGNRKLNTGVEAACDEGDQSAAGR